MTFDEGLRLFKAGQYKSAAEILQETVSSDDQNHKAWNALGVSYTKLGQHDEAAACFARAIQIAPDNQVYLKNRDINIQKKNGNGNSATHPSPAHKGIKKSPVIFVFAAIFVGMICIGCVSLFAINSGLLPSGNPATPSYTPVTPTLTPPAPSPGSETRYDTLCTEGTELLKAEKPDDALMSFEKAIEINPDALRALTGKGYALIDLGRYDAAITAFDTALQLNATYDSAKAGREIALEASGKNP